MGGPELAVAPGPQHRLDVLDDPAGAVKTRAAMHQDRLREPLKREPGGFVLLCRKRLGLAIEGGDLGNFEAVCFVVSD